jgi:hypothetical protein
VSGWQGALSRPAPIQIEWRGPLTRGALLLMESFWAYALMAFWIALTVGGGKPTPLGVAAVVFLSFGVSRALQQSGLDLPVLRIWGALISFLIFYVIVRVDFYGDWRVWDFTWADTLFFNITTTIKDNLTAVFGIPFLWLFWVRGILRGQEYLNFEGVVGSFAIGLVIIGVVEVFADSVHAPAPVGQVAMPYVALGLLAIGLMHAARSEDRSGKSVTTTWIGAVIGAVIFLGAIALLFTIVDFGPATDLVKSVSDEVGYVIAKTLYYIIYPVAYGIEQFLYGVRWLLEQLGGDRSAQQNQRQPFPTPAGDDNGGAGRLTPWLDLLFRILVWGGLAAVLLVGTALLFDRYLRRARPGEVKESTYQEGRLQADLSDLLNSMLGRLRPKGRPPGVEMDAARRLYFDMLAAGAERGVERQPPETPLELAPRLGQTFAAETTSRITTLFDDVRYGDAPVRDDEVKRLRDEWEQGRA